MRIGDLKRAVEDVILRPDENPLQNIEKRDTIAALDLCQPEASASESSRPASRTDGSCSSEVEPGPQTRQQQQLCTSTSLDTIVLRHHSFPTRASAVGSRRSSRVLPHYLSKRKRSNSLTSCYKGRPQGGSASLPQSSRQTPCILNQGDSSQGRWTKWSLASSDSHSSVAHSEVLVREEEEDEQDYPINHQQFGLTSDFSIPPSSISPMANSFTAFRDSSQNDSDMDCD